MRTVTELDKLPQPIANQHTNLRVRMYLFITKTSPHTCGIQFLQNLKKFSLWIHNKRNPTS